MVDYVGYVRVSTVKQGQSGLGLDAQQAAISAYLKPGDTLLAPVYVEVRAGSEAIDPDGRRHWPADGRNAACGEAGSSFPKQPVPPDCAEQWGRCGLLRLPWCPRGRGAVHGAADGGGGGIGSGSYLREDQGRAEGGEGARGVKLGGFRGVKVDPALGLAEESSVSAGVCVAGRSGHYGGQGARGL